MTLHLPVFLEDDSTFGDLNVFSSVYLKSSVLVLGGNRSKKNPYLLTNKN